MRVKGKNWWEWVFIGTLAVLHVIQPGRGKAVVAALVQSTLPDPASCLAISAQPRLSVALLRATWGKMAA